MKENMNNLNQDLFRHDSLLRLCPFINKNDFKYDLTTYIGVYYITQGENNDSYYENLIHNNLYVLSPEIYPGDDNWRYNFSIEERISLHVV